MTPHAQGNIEGIDQGAVFEGGGSTCVGSGGHHCEGQTAPDNDEVAAVAASGGGMEGERMESLDRADRGEEQRFRWELEGGVGGGQAGWHQLSCGRLAGMKGGGDSLLATI